MVSRLQQDRDPVGFGCRHLEEYLGTEVGARKPKGGSRQVMSTQELSSQANFRERAKTNAVPIARLIGFEAKDIADGRAAVVLAAGSQHANPMGTLHGGILCDIADAAMGIAFASTLAREESFTTVELKINIFRPVWQAQLKAERTVVRRGHTIGYVECTITDEENRLVARAASTCMVLRGQNGRRVARAAWARCTAPPTRNSAATWRSSYWHPEHSTKLAPNLGFREAQTLSSLSPSFRFNGPVFAALDLLVPPRLLAGHPHPISGYNQP
jgi:uncharacterized protein (TIGR00369 family)